jgi:predicted nucleotide-binding protein
VDKVLKTKPEGWPRTVIVADDNTAQQRAVRDFVEKSCGHRALQVRDWRVALDALRSARGDRLILNFYMGHSQNEGKALLQALRTGGPDIPTIIIAPHEDRNVRPWCAGFPFVKWFLDPSDLQANFTQVQEILSRPPDSDMSAQQPTKRGPPGQDRTVAFVVHGGHSQRKRVFKILQSLNVQPVYLEGEPVRGRVVIEALEHYAQSVNYAICIFSADDVGYRKDQQHARSARARQNVVFEAGFFTAALTRDHVMILHEEGVELPSDMSGILSIPLSLSNEKLRERFIQTLSDLQLPFKITFDKG